MTKEELFRAVGEVREDLVTDAETVKKVSRPWRRYGAMAACLAVVLAAAFALERLEDARRWAELEAGFQTADKMENAPDSGGGADAGGLDGAEYRTDGEKRPASNYSVNVEIGELDRKGTESAKRVEGAPAEDRAEISMSACLAWLEPGEIFAQDTAIFRGTVRDLRYYVVTVGGMEMPYTAASVEVTDRIRGDVLEGEVRTILYMGGLNMTSSISGPLTDLEEGSDAIFMPIAATPETGRRDGDSYFCYADLGEFYISEGMRYVFLDTGDGLSFERGVYKDIADAETLDEVADYIRGMTGVGERVQIARYPVEPQAAPGNVAEADPALLYPSYGVSGPAGARELPGGAIIGDEEKD